MPQYEKYDQKIARDLWEGIQIKLDEFVPLRALREGIAVVARVDIDAFFELGNDCAVNLALAGCEIQIDAENQQVNLQGGLQISNEMRAVLTVEISRALPDELKAATEACADWIEATAGAPNGFIGETYTPTPGEEVEAGQSRASMDENDEEEEEAGVSADSPYQA